MAHVLMAAGAASLAANAARESGAVSCPRAAAITRGVVRLALTAARVRTTVMSSMVNRAVAPLARFARDPQTNAIYLAISLARMMISAAPLVILAIATARMTQDVVPVGEARQPRRRKRLLRQRRRPPQNPLTRRKSISRRRLLVRKLRIQQRPAEAKPLLAHPMPSPQCPPQPLDPRILLLTCPIPPSHGRATGPQLPRRVQPPAARPNRFWVVPSLSQSCSTISPAHIQFLLSDV
ncbi:hypothetical protein B0H10DRAFT_2079123 [Mycena sp. CBHHK59/15]|nr:hypothetical protein B0H10DRAFT_2079123 [Mycena sp. CBHHK59/15]